MEVQENCYRSTAGKFLGLTFEKEEEFKYLGTTLTNKILCRKKLRAD
jgi:hypothetical protein